MKFLGNHKEKVHSVQQLFASARNASSVEDAQKVLFPESSIRQVMQILSVLPKDPGAKDKNSDIMLTRKVLTGVLIYYYGEDMLGNSSPGAAGNAALKSRTIAVRHSATVLCRQFDKLLKGLASSKELKIKDFRRLLWQFQFSIRFYLQKFREWKSLDAEILQQSMEETFAQSYQNLLMAKVAFRTGNANENIVAAAEEQSNRLRDVLRQILGPQKAASRMEEITASIESSFPEYLRLFGEPTTPTTPSSFSPAPSSQRTFVASSSNSNENVNSSATASNSTSLVDTSELRRTLTPLPDDSTGSSSSNNRTSTEASVKPTSADGNATPPSLSDAESTRYLQLLSKLAGIENERLAHELTLDKFFRLPEKRSNSMALSTRKPTIMHALRSKMLNVMADKLINALRRSNINNVSELAVGMIVPVKLFAKSRPTPLETATNNAEYYILSAEILNIVASPTKDEQEGPLKLTVRYLSDDSVEDDVSSARVKLFDEAPDASPMIAAFVDIAQSIAGFIQNRSELRQKLAQLFDPELLLQVANQGTLSPTRDILPICLGLQQILLSLQAEYRLEDAVAWLKCYEELFRSPSLLSSYASRAPATASGPPSLQSMESNGAMNPSKPTPEALWQVAKLRYFPLRPLDPQHSGSETDSNQWMALIPLFLEHTTDNLEDIQRDTANFYISQLVPILQSHGRSFLAQRFKDRLMQGLVSLDRCAHWLQLLITPETLLPSFLQQLPTPFDQIWQAVRPSLGLTALNAVLKDCEVVLPSSSSSFSSSSSSSSSTSGSGSPSSVITLELLAALPPAASSDTAVVTLSGGFEQKLVSAVVGHGLCTLLQVPVRLDTSTNPRSVAPYLIPETLEWDGKRLAELRDLIDTIALECGITLSVRQLLQQRYRIAHREDEEVELQHRLDVLLRSGGTDVDDADGGENSAGGESSLSSSSSAPVSMQNLITEVVRYVEYAIYRNREVMSSGASSPLFHPAGSSTASVSLSASSSSSSSSSTAVLGATNAAQLLPHYDVREVTALVEKLLREVVVHEQSPVLQLFLKRLYRVLMRACLGQPYMHKLASFSLQSKAQERNLARMVDLGTKLCAHTVAVHGGIYREVLRALAGKLLPLVASNDHNTARDATESSGASHGNHHSSG